MILQRQPRWRWNRREEPPPRWSRQSPTNSTKWMSDGSHFLHLLWKIFVQIKLISYRLNTSLCFKLFTEGSALWDRFGTSFFWFQLPNDNNIQTPFFIEWYQVLETGLNTNSLNWLHHPIDKIIRDPIKQRPLILSIFWCHQYNKVKT